MELIQKTLIVELCGELDQHTATQVRTEIDNEINSKGVVNLVLDFASLTFMDSSGIGVVLGRYKTILARGGKTLIVRANPQVDKLLELSGIKKIISTNQQIDDVVS